MSAKLTVLILAKNEEKNIADCLRSVRFADEVIVVDSGSNDMTCKIAEDSGAKVYQHPMEQNGFAGQRNYALTKTNADWVLYLDADERITPELAHEIRQHIEGNTSQAAAIKRMNVVMGQLMHYGVYRPDYVVRLFPRNQVRWEGLVHEKAITSLQIAKLKAPAHHHCLNTWEQYFQKFDHYTTLMAEKMQQQGKKTNTLMMHLHAGYAFFQMYVLKLGFMDGTLGFILCQYHYFYTLTKYTKLAHLLKK